MRKLRSKMQFVLGAVVFAAGVLVGGTLVLSATNKTPKVPHTNN